MTTLHRVQVTPLPGSWGIEVDGLPGHATAIAHPDIERIARKFIALNTGSPVGDVRLVIGADGAARAGSPAGTDQVTRSSRSAVRSRWPRALGRHRA